MNKPKEESISEEGIPSGAIKATWKPTWAAIILLFAFLIWAGAMAGSLVISPGMVENLPMELLPGNYTGTIEGLVIDEATSRPIDGVRVRFAKGSGIETGDDGRFFVPDAPLGIYKLTVSAPNYKTAKVKVSVWPEQLIQLSGQMRVDLSTKEVIELRKGPGETATIEGSSIGKVRQIIFIARLICGLAAVAGVPALLASISSFRRKSYKFAFVCSIIFALPCLLFILLFPLGLVLVIISWIPTLLIFKSKDEFFWAEMKGKTTKA
ncbi:MAG TPA: carboxypeptidase regulatory-like domain-containing protein [Thermoplasmata archaeon]|nr:carboxypeptidase regulatory-like domain-containing protein [Thermoplasmata archaeon]